MKRVIITVFMVLMLPVLALGQFYEIAGRISRLVRPALSGSFNYRGFVDVSYVKGLGNYNADFLELSTSHGFQYSDWFFMGVGIGVDGVFTHPRDNWGSDGSIVWPKHDNTDSGVMIPVFTDFRFNVGNDGRSASVYADLRVGCSFLINNNWLRINNGYITGSEYFYLKPAVGVRIPVNDKYPRRALNIGVSYQLLTSDFWYGADHSVVINSLGVNVGYEW